MKKIKSVKKYEAGGTKEEQCDPIRGCGHKRAQRVNNRRSALNKVPVGKVLGAIGAGIAGAFAIKNKDKIKEKLGIEKKGGTIKSKMKKGGMIKMKKK
jgi:hypothetical protein